MKSDMSIKNIALASVKRHSIGMEQWKKTLVNPEHLPSGVERRPTELHVILLNYNKQNWTLITTQRIVGMIDNVIRAVDFAELDDVAFGMYKDTRVETTIFRTTDINGNKKDFLMETGYPSMAYVYGIGTIENMYKTST